MRRCMLVVLVGLLVAIPAYGRDYEQKGKAGSYAVTVTFDRNQPAKGENRIDVGIADAAAKPVTDATVVVQYLMPSLPGRPPMMEYKTTATREGTGYKAVLDLSMAGEWVLIVNVTRGGKTGIMKFSLIVR